MKLQARTSGSSQTGIGMSGGMNIWWKWLSSMQANKLQLHCEQARPCASSIKARSRIATSQIVWV